MEQSTQQSNPFSNLHKQRLYALIVAGVGFISLLLAWRTTMGYTITNGFSGVGVISLLGVIGAIIASFLGDKTKEYDQNTKMIALASFGAIALGALLTLVTKYHGVPTGAGIGVWLALIAGIAGLAWVYGLVKLPPPAQKPPTPPPAS